jgi:hypothetical protein
MKKKTTFSSATEYLSANTVVSESSSLSPTDVNRDSLLSALYTENPVHKGNDHCPITSNSNSNSFLPPRRHSSDDLDKNDDCSSSNDKNDNNGTWRVVQ